MRKIPLTRGEFALVDDEDFEMLNAFKWHCLYCGSGTRKIPYAKRSDYSSGKQIGISMHRVILGAASELVDHIDGNGLNNQKSNLRLCTHAQNLMNQRKQRFDHFKGVRFHKKDKRWQAYIVKDKRMIHLGSFDFSIDAAIAYNEAAKRLFGEFANLNQIPE